MLAQCRVQSGIKARLLFGVKGQGRGIQTRIEARLLCRVRVRVRVRVRARVRVTLGFKRGERYVSCLWLGSRDGVRVARRVRS